MLFTQVLSDARSREKPCIRCGYSLRGSLDVRYCPECGLSVWLSLNQNEDMDWSNPVWTSNLSFASWIMAASQVLGMLAWMLLASPAGWASHRIAGSVLAGIYFLVYHATMLALLCRHENRYPDRLKSQRRATQVVSIIACLIGILLCMPAMGMMRTGIGRFFIELTFAASILCTWTFFRRLSRRIPNPTATRICGWLLLMPLVPFCKAMPFLTLYLAYQFSWFFTLVPILYFPATAILLGWFALTLGRCSGNGAANWARETMK